MARRGQGSGTGRFAAGLAAALTAVVWTASPPAAWAAPLPGTDLSDLALEELLQVSVYGASKHEQKAWEAPSSVTVVPGDEIRAQGHRTLADVLAAVRSFYVTNDWNYSYLGVRGFSRPGDFNSRVLLLVDGHRVNDPLYGQAPIGYDFPLDVALIDRVEVVRGPGSSLYGSNAFFAVINVVTRRGKGLSGVELSGLAGSDGTFQGRATAGKTLAGGTEVALSGTYYDSDGEDLDIPGYGKTAGGTNAEEAKSAFARVAAKGLSLQGAYVTREKAVPTASYGTVFNDPRNASDDTRYFVDLRYEGELSKTARVTGRLSYDWYGYDQDYVYDAPPLYLSRDEAETAWWTGEVHVDSSAVKGHRLTGGAEYRADVRVDQRYFDVDPFAAYLDDHRRSSTYGFFLQDEVELRKNALLSAGVRYDHYRGFGGTTNPRLALIVHEEGTKGVGKLMYGSAFRAPNAYELYYNDGNATWKPPAGGLEPEKIHTYEASWEQPLGKRLFLTAGGFYYRIKNLITLTTDPADGLFVFENVEQVEAQGVELQLDAKWESGAAARAAWTLQHAEDRETGEWLTNSPEQIFWLSGTVPVYGKALQAGAEGRYLGRRRTLSGGTAPGAGLVNLTLQSREAVRGLTLSGTVYNLLDEEIVAPAGEEHAFDTIPQEGRSFRVQATYRF